jgi:hypothetical protein
VPTYSQLQNDESGASSDNFDDFDVVVRRDCDLSLPIVDISHIMTKVISASFVPGFDQVIWYFLKLH